MNVLNKKVLLLNQSYQPLMTLNAKRAIILSFTEKVDILERYSDKVYSVNLTISLPSVIRLKNYVHIKHKQLPLNRKNLLKRDSNTCQYCNINEGFMTIDHIIPKDKGGDESWLNLVTACKYCNKNEGFMTIDHIIPKDKGGSESWSNLVTACKTCNTNKGNFFLKDINMKLIKKPKKPSILYSIQYALNSSQSSWKPYLFMKE